MLRFGWLIDRLEINALKTTPFPIPVDFLSNRQHHTTNRG